MVFQRVLGFASAFLQLPGWLSVILAEYAIRGIPLRPP